MKTVLFCYDGPIYYCDGFYYSVGFTNKVLERYLVIADKLLFAVRVVCLKTIDQSKYSRIDNPAITIIALPSLSSPKAVLSNLKKAKSLLLNCLGNVDFIVIRFPSLLGALCWRIAKKQGRKVVVEVVGNAKETYYYHSFFGKIVCVPFDNLIKSCIKESDFVSYITSSYLQSVYPTKGMAGVCPNVMIDGMEEGQKMKRIAHNSNIGSQKKIVICSIGTVSEVYKGHEYVIKAIRDIEKRGRITVEYWIVGDGDNHRLKDICRKTGTTENVKFLGQVRHDAIVDILDKVDFYIQPSLSEAQGRSLIEAMSRGCLCLCSNVGGMKELIPEDFRFKKKSAKDLVRVFLRAMTLSKDDLEKETLRNISRSNAFVTSVVNQNRSTFFEMVKENV